jgi:hypothetical protein
MVTGLIDLFEGFTGSDIESTLHHVGEEAFRGGGADRLKPDFLLDTFANTVPPSRVNPERSRRSVPGDASGRYRPAARR